MAEKSGFSVWRATKDIPARLDLEGLLEGGPLPVHEVREFLVRAYQLGWQDCEAYLKAGKGNVHG